MVVPRVVVELRPKVGSPAGDRSLISHFDIRSIRSSAALSWVSLCAGFHKGECRSASMTTTVGRSWRDKGSLVIIPSHASRPVKVRGALYTFDMRKVVSSRVIAHVARSREVE